jgi:hypothetical protein
MMLLARYVKIENGELPKCDRLRIKSNTDVITGKNVCSCIKYEQEKRIIYLMTKESSSPYERQMNAAETIELEREAHEDFMKTSEV